jgi:hypothetical protein
MIEERAMTVRENVHQLIDALPEERLDDVLDYLLARLEQLAENPFDPRLSRPLTGLGDLRRSRVDG